MQMADTLQQNIDRLSGGKNSVKPLPELNTNFYNNIFKLKDTNYLN